MGIYTFEDIYVSSLCISDYMIILWFIMIHTFGSEWCYDSNFRPCNHDLDELLMVCLAGHSAIDGLSCC